MYEWVTLKDRHLNDLIQRLYLLGYYDEASTLFGSLGRYSEGGTAFDNSVYNTLLEAPRSIKREFKAGRSVIIEPRLQLTVCTHLQYKISSLISNYFKFYYITKLFKL